MLRSFIWTLISCFFLLSLFAEDEALPPSEPFVSSLVKTQSLLSTTVDSVSAISGEWLHSETDFVVLGPEPLVLNRYYTGDHAHSDKLGYNWDFNRPHKLIIDAKEKGSRHAKITARLNQASGIATIHDSAPSQEKIHHIIPLLLSRTQGLTNCRSGEISAKTNLHNTVIQLDFKEKHCTTLSGSGHVTYYEYSHQQDLSEWKQGKIGAGYYKAHLLDHYKPRYERKANGNTFLFDKGNISATNSSQTQIYSSIQFSSLEDGSLKAEASDGKIAIYKFTTYDHKIKLGHNTSSKKRSYSLSEVSYSHQPTETYAYTHLPPEKQTDHPPNPLLKCKYRPDGRFQEAEYYHAGSNEVDGVCQITIPDADDFRYHRVKLLKAPVGPNHQTAITHRFVYEADKFYQPVKKHQSSFSGKTEVYDAYLRKTVYIYNKEHRPTTIKRYDLNDQLYSEEVYMWDDHYVYPHQLKKSGFENLKNQVNELFFSSTDFSSSCITEKANLVSDQWVSSLSESICQILPKPDLPASASLISKKIPIEELIKRCMKSKVLQTSGSGNLIGKYFKDNKGEILYAQFFDYDGKGNIKVDRFYGNVTGKNSHSILLDLHNIPIKNGVECYEKRFTYSDDMFNLLTTEEEDNGKGMIYEYYPETDLVAAKYVTNHSKIQFRQFFYYDSQATLIKLIKDDGCTKEESNLEGVTERQITYIFPRQEAPFGLPKKVDEMYVDLDSENKQEMLLKRVECEYSIEGHLLKQHHYDANGIFCYSLEWDYDAHGNVIFEKNALGQILCKKYDENDNLTHEEGPYVGNQPRTDICKTHHYDHANRLEKTLEEHPDGKIFSISHVYDLVGNCTETTNRFGEKISYEYDDFNRLVRIQYPPMVNDQREIIVPFITKEYDSANRLISLTDTCGHKTQTLYNAKGSPLKITHADGTVEKFEYSTDGSLAKSIARNGAQTVYKRDFLGRILLEEFYDAHHQLLSRQTFTYQGLRLVNQTDAEGCKTLYTYDHAGRLKSETCVKSCKRYDYDSLGRIAKITQYDVTPPHEQIVQAFEYDLLNRPTEERLEDAVGKVLEQTQYEYDGHGNRILTIRHKEAGASITTIQYNADKKPVEIVTPEGDITYLTYDETHKNGMGQKVLKVITTDGLGRTTEEIHDAFGRVSEITRKDPLGKVLAKQEINYDPMGRRTKTQETVMRNGVEQRLSINTWHYHANGQEDLMTEAVETPLEKSTRTYYNACGEKWKIVKPDEVELLHNYDAFGRLSQLTASDGSISYTYTYNLCHQLTKVQDQKCDATTTRHYDKMQRLKEETLGNGLQLLYDYDHLGRPVEIQLPDQSHIHYVYDAAYLREVQRYKQDHLVYRHAYLQYDPSGDLLESSLIGKGGSIRYSYDRTGRPKQTNHPQWSQQVPNGGYDLVGRLAKTTILDVSSVTPYYYQYDDLDHLLTEQGHIANTYQVDSIHNRLQKNQQLYEINDLNQIMQQTDCQYTYDLNGNLVLKEQGSHVTEYDYDALNRLTAVRSAQDETLYQYDTFNRRLSKVHNGMTSYYLYQGQNEIGCADEKGNIQELRILGSGFESELGSAIALELQGRIFVPLHDHQGHLACLLDSVTGNTVESYRYTAFGEESIYNAQGQKISDSQVSNPWRFACKRVDPETGWIYFGRRHYDPETGRWTTPDPLFFEDGPNLYAYLHHSPVMKYDAYGLFADETYTDQADSTFSPFSELSDRRDNSNSSFLQRTKDAFLNGLENPLTAMKKHFNRSFYIDTRQADFTNSEQKFSVENVKSIFTHAFEDSCEQTGALVTCMGVGKTAQFTKTGITAIGGYLTRRVVREIIFDELETTSTRATPGENVPVKSPESPGTTNIQTIKGSRVCSNMS